MPEERCHVGHRGEFPNVKCLSMYYPPLIAYRGLKLALSGLKVALQALDLAISGLKLALQALKQPSSF